MVRRKWRWNVSATGHLVAGRRGAAIAIVSGDFNGDGRPDLAFTSLPVSGLSTEVPKVGNVNLQDGVGELLQVFPAGDANILLNTTPAITFTDANAAGYQRGAMAQDSIVAAFGAAMASTTAQSAALGTNLGGITVTVKDSTGTSRQADLFYVSPRQINYAMPAGTATGPATIAIANGPNTATATQQIVSVLPGVFSINGIAEAIVETFQNGAMTSSSFSFELTTSGTFAPTPIDVSAGDVFLLMYGTGIRHASSVTATVGSQSGLPVAYAGPSGYVGEDQINLQLPPSLAGAGLVNVTLTADGQTSNPVQIQIK